MAAFAVEGCKLIDRGAGAGGVMADGAPALEELGCATSA